MTSADDQAALRYQTVRAILREMADVDGWALTKGWFGPESSSGDVDLLVEPALRPRVEARLLSVLHGMGPQVALAFCCEHIPGVPRVFALLPELGFRDSLLEIDLAELIPLRGYPLVTLTRLSRFVDRDGDGVPRLKDEVVEVLKVIASLPWGGRPPLLTPETRRILGGLSPLAVRWVWESRWLGPYWGLALSVLMVVSAVGSSPGTLASRVPFRLRQIARGRACPFDPRGGRAVRFVVRPDVVLERALLSGHEVVIRRW